MRTFYHDPSTMYADTSASAETNTIKVQLRAINPRPVQTVAVRILDDAEPKHIEARPITKPNTVAGEYWWEAEIPVVGLTQHYRWHIGFTDKTTLWLNALGEFKRTVPDHADFKIQVGGTVPQWYSQARIYQIFIDRFARRQTLSTQNLPQWSTGWISDNISEFAEGPGQRNLYGGDLWGIIDKLDYIQGLGFDTLYLTPFFEARTNHRYDARTFWRVDPFLGGDEALIALIEACHARGMKFIGDLTTNHTGLSHEWFEKASTDPTSIERDFYYWDENGDYACWLGVKNLPKLNYNSAELRRRMFGESGVVRRYLEPPFNMDGWRIDVANMTGRYQHDNLYPEVSLLTRQAVEAADPAGQKVLIAEHCHDFGPDIKGNTWQGAMNYAGFTRPFWDWLCPETVVPRFLGTLADLHSLPGSEVVDTIDAFGAETTWQVRQASYNLVSSHDTPRIFDTLVGPYGAFVGLAAAYTLPGVPMVLYGEELLLPSVNGDNCRVPMPWDEAFAGATDLADWLRSLAALRFLPAVTEGGLRWVYVSDDVIVFARETASQRLLVGLCRDMTAGVSVNDELLSFGNPTQVLAGQVTVVAGELQLEFANGVAIAQWEL